MQEKITDIDILNIIKYIKLTQQNTQIENIYMTFEFMQSSWSALELNSFPGGTNDLGFFKVHV